jgi:hypothetical protein
MVDNGYSAYEVLGIDRNTEKSEIGKIKRSLLSRYHPDKVGVKDNVARCCGSIICKVISESYENIEHKKPFIDQESSIQFIFAKLLLKKRESQKEWKDFEDINSMSLDFVSIGLIILSKTREYRENKDFKNEITELGMFIKKKIDSFTPEFIEMFNSIASKAKPKSIKGLDTLQRIKLNWEYYSKDYKVSKDLSDGINSFLIAEEQVLNRVDDIFKKVLFEILTREIKGKK